MNRSISRRDFLKLSGLAFGSLAFPWPPFQPWNRPYPDLMGRVTIDEIDVYAEPRSEVNLIVGKRYRDQVIILYSAVVAPEGPAYNPIWYRLWGGYIHSAYVQMVKMRFNQVMEAVPSNGMLCEVSVPYSDALRYSRYEGWKQQYRLYYETTHWVTGLQEGPDGQPWYQITNELDKMLTYYAPASHLRPIPAEELTPLSPEVPDEEKRIEVSIREQVARAYEGDQLVLEAKVSTGIHSTRPSTNGIPTHTPRGDYRIGSKSPSKHMGSIQASGAPGGYSLPGVPWTSFFIPETGVAFHGTFWHNNFGVQMSHGCVNMRNADAKWIFRWSTPYWEESKEGPAWDARGYGTKVSVV
jgi:lipoprotein-anchoring transpeptidase ErfK/SrfK